MYGIKPDTDFSALVGKVVIQVCFGSNEVIVNLDGNIHIAVESVCRYIDARRNSVTEVDVYRDVATELCRMLGQSIVAVSGDPDGTLTISFSMLDTFILMDDSPQYESYRIEGPDFRIVV